MLNPVEWLRAYRRRRIEAWRTEKLRQFLQEIIPSGIPYFQGCAPRFLQWDTPDPEHLVRVDLSFPEVPLCVDFCGSDLYPDYHVAKKFISRPAWDVRRREMLHKETVLQSLGCSYLRFWDYEYTGTEALQERVRQVLGHNL